MPATFRIIMLALALSLSACEYLPFDFTPIGQILDQAASFEGREVKIRGRVVDVNKIPLIDVRTYTLRDNSGEIVVLNPTELPGIGDEIALRGRVESLVILGGLSMGTIVKETGRLPVISDFKP